MLNKYSTHAWKETCKIALSGPFTRLDLPESETVPLIFNGPLKFLKGQFHEIFHLNFSS